MKWFLKMVDYAKEYRFILDAKAEKAVNMQEEARNIYNKFLPKCEIFLFNTDSMPEQGHKFGMEDLEIEAPPFECFSIEIKNNISLYSVRNGKLLFCSIMTCEIEPGKYCFYILTIEKELDEYSVFYCSYKDPSIAYIQCKNLIDDYIKSIHNGVEGIEKTKKYLTIGPKKRKNKHRISRIIHISKNKITAKEQKPFGCNGGIDWSHSWLVRGHWRKVNGIGKNRNGDYCISGKTFVIPHQKGKGETVKKIRVV